MKTHLLLFLVLGLLISPVFASAKDEWTSVKSKNFELIGDAAEKDIRRVATKFEQFRETFRKLLPKANFDSAIPTRVVVFKNSRSYKPFKPVRADGKTDEWVAGYFQPGEDVNYITLSVEGEDQEIFGTIFHEYVHFMLENNYGRSTIPPWFNEGLAGYYQTFSIENDQKVSLGKLQDEHLLLLNQNKLIPLETFFAIDNFSLHNQGNHGKNMFYAQAWALQHYLQQGNKGARRGQLTKFIGLLQANKTPREAFQEAFQTDYQTMEKELRDYVGRRSFNYETITFKEKLTFDAEIKSAAISDAEASAFLGDLLLHTHRLDDAAARLQQAIAADDKLAMAHASMGMTRMRQKKFPEAKKHLEKAVALNANNYLAHYYYGYVLSREPMGGENGYVSRYESGAAEKIRSSLVQAIKLKPDFAESYRLAAFVNLVNNENLDEGITLLKRALQYEPGNQWFALDLAQIYARQEKFDDARKIAEKIAATAVEPELRSGSQAILGQINSMAEQTAHIKALKERGDNVMVVEQSEATTPEEAMNQAINQALRKPQAGETRVLGHLTEIECDSKGQAFVVRADNQTLKLRLGAAQGLLLMAFTPEMNGGQINCGARKPENFVVATYKTATDAKAKAAGEIVALEFVPNNFKLKQ